LQQPRRHHPYDHAPILGGCRHQVKVSHPINPEVSGVNLIMLRSGDRRPGVVSRNTVVLNNGPLLRDDPATWTGALDRSPCGTGTSSRMAALHARGQLRIGEDFLHRSIIDSEFVGRLVGETMIGDQPAVLPTITGRGWITGRSQWTLDPSDPSPPASRSVTSGRRSSSPEGSTSQELLGVHKPCQHWRKWWRA
jgi:proline racemase